MERLCSFRPHYIEMNLQHSTHVLLMYHKSRDKEVCSLEEIGKKSEIESEVGLCL